MAEKRERIRRRSGGQEPGEVWLLERELCETSRRIKQAHDAFNLVSDPDLIEAWVYEINAQQAHYAYLLKRRKALGAPEPEKDEVRT